MNVHLIDGTYELFRAFYAVPSSRTQAGVEVGASRAFARSLLSLLREPGVTHVACAFDHVIESFRNQLFAGYKTGEGIDPDLFSQFELVEEVCAALGVVVWSMIEFEADDALAAGAARYATDPAVECVFLCSPDKDLAQCVQGSKVVCLDRMRKRVLDESGVIAKFGVPPSAIPDYLALVGDSADGIPGVPRWGAKSAAALLARYGSIDAVPDDHKSWDVSVRGAQALAESLRESRSAAALYRRLATLRRDVPLRENLDDLRYRGAPRARLEQLCARLEDPALLERVPTIVNEVLG